MQTGRQYAGPLIAAELRGPAKATKNVKVTPNQFGNQVEVEMHDKQAALRLLAKHHALLEPSGDQNRPSLIGINLKGPQVISYEVEDGDD